jgi:phage replication O-like protein O
MLLEQPLASYNGKPEIDDGHTKIANELLDAIIAYDFSKRQLKILLLIMRKTYGWNKSEDDISRSQIVEATGLLNPHVTTAIQELQSKNVLIISNGKYAKKYKINKYYDQWRVTETVTITESVPLTETVTITETVTNRYQNGNNPLPKQYPQKTTPKDNTKDNIKEKILNKKISLKEFIENCKQANIKTIDDSDSIFEFIDQAHIPTEFLNLAWLSFKNQYLENESKKQIDWRDYFRNYIRRDWVKLWYFKDEVCTLNTAGIALQNFNKKVAANG